MLTLPCWPPCVWTPTGSQRYAPTETGRRCGSCSPLAKTSSVPPPRKRTRALLLAGDDTDRHAARSTLTDASLTTLARRRVRSEATRSDAIRQGEIRRLALALREAERQLKENRKQMQSLVDDLAPGLTSHFGIGPVSAAQAIVSFSHPGRCRNEAAFAALAGTSPLPASSGRTIRHRLNRGGDRALNRATHTIALTRIRSCPRTRAYIARRTAEGKSPARSDGVSSDTSPASSTAPSLNQCPR
jgi:transposase